MYWSERKKRLDASMAKDESRLYAKRAAYYDREAARLDREIAAYYSKYSVDGVLSYRNLLETLPEGDKRLLIRDMDAFVKKYPEYADLVPVRESIYKLNRLEGLRQSIAMQQLEMGASDIEAARAFFQRQSLRYANGAAAFLGLGSSFYTIDSDMVNRFVGNAWCDGMDFSARIWANRSKLARALQTEILNGVIRGDSYQRVSKAVQQKFTDVSKRDIERLVFTEDTYLSNEAAMGVFETDGVTEEYIFVCAPVGACPICQALNGQRFKIKDRQPGENFPPMHPWCRCFFDPVVGSLDVGSVPVSAGEAKTKQSSKNSEIFHGTKAAAKPKIVPGDSSGGLKAFGTGLGALSYLSTADVKKIRERLISGEKVDCPVCGNQYLKRHDGANVFFCEKCGYRIDLDAVMGAK